MEDNRLDIQFNFFNLRDRKPSSVLLVDYFENSSPYFGERFPKDDPFYELIEPAFATGDFSGKWKQGTIIYTYGKLPETRIMLLGLGNKEEISPFKIKIAFGYALKYLALHNVKEVTAFIDKKCCPGEFCSISEFLAEAAYLSQYKHPSYKKNKPEHFPPIEQINLILPEGIDAESISELSKGVQEGKMTGSVVNEVRTLVDMPSNFMTPTALANHARKLARENASVTCQVLEKDELISMGMGGIINVGKGSHEPPCLIQCSYTPEDNKVNRTIAIVGKGVTFDSGGICIKPDKGMDRMKDDMAGAAIALGIIKLAAMLKLPIKLVGLMPCCENMLGGNAMKPGDIITAYDGTSVEIINTDAEGRLALMDALGYAVKQKVDAIIDLATLTGACTIALGRFVIGGMTNHQPIMDLLRESGDTIYERVWQFPLMEEYKLPLKSIFADLKNHGGREGGAIVAGAFLSHFVGKTPWVHLDIAGVTWFDSETSLYPDGASGIGVRLVIDFLKRLCSKDYPEVWGKQATSIDGPTFKENEVSMEHPSSAFRRNVILG